VVVALVAFRGRRMQGRDHRHAPAVRDGLAVRAQELPACGQWQPVRQGHDRLATYGRVLPCLAFVHHLREFARRALKTDALAP
jgi:hypothetical protein